MTKIGIFAIILPLSAAFSQEPLKFTVPTDSSGAPMPVVAPQKPDTVQKLGIASNRPLNLIELSAKDTASFETYSRRIGVVQDSISAGYRTIEALRIRTKTLMPQFPVKDEFEKQNEFEARVDKWNRELAERTERDTKQHTARLEELNKAKKKIEDHQASLYSSISIKTNPSAASIWIGKEEIGATPADYSYLIPGTVKITIRKEGYDPWDTTFQAVPGGKFNIATALEEKSIFSKDNEVNFTKILSKDATVEVYRSRISTLEARGAEVDKEIGDIINDFAEKYPPLEPMRPDETQGDFNKRHESWAREGNRQVVEFQKKHSVYKDKLARSIEVLNDYIISTESMIVNEPSFGTKIELGAYDADMEQFEIVAQDSASEKSPFYFKGKVRVPRDTAKAMNRAAPGFLVNLQYINFPFKADSANVNLAMHKLSLSKSGMDLKTDGSFGEIMRYVVFEGYGSWKARADSLLGGGLKPQGLDYAYAMGKKADVGFKPEPKEPGEGLGWRGWTRIGTFTAAAIFGGVAVFKHLSALENKENRKDLESKMQISKEDVDLHKEFDDEGKSLKANQSQRTTFGVVAGVFAIGGIVTFFF